MCGKFTAMASWSEVVDFSRPLSSDNDQSLIFRPMSLLPLVVLDADLLERAVVRMRWGFPHRSNPNRLDIIHVRSESINEKKAFKEAFHSGQRGIVVFKTFNEGKEITPRKTEQWTIDPLDGQPRGFAFLWKRFDIEGLPLPLLACVMCTVPASQLIAPITDRMPAILADEDWPVWLGEVPATPAEVKACLKTVEDVRWTMTKEERATKRSKPTVRDPGGLF